ncbi:hypothetical protein N7520_005234 [Penicillium odoratum]|uniref:uncharacterized protein n=1 Tax=Penicillium odoratum TaxID=1167516 RepID=UPI002547BF73|nr:uncharacterized protein N7520_005234 [Penicillium odoratum]KAJ5765675.1 hypothetical protein N7520_005234 [Penicillium odoratum]
MSKIPQRTRLVKWWPIGFAIAAVIFLATGAALLGVELRAPYSPDLPCNSYSYYYSYIHGHYCEDGDDSKFYAGVVCIGIGGLLKLIAWILFVIWCVKRPRIQQTNITHTNNAPVEDPPSYDTLQPVYSMKQGAPFAPESPASPGPMYVEAAVTPPSKEGVASATAYESCSQ